MSGRVVGEMAILRQSTKLTLLVGVKLLAFSRVVEDGHVTIFVRTADLCDCQTLVILAHTCAVIVWEADNIEECTYLVGAPITFGCDFIKNGINLFVGHPPAPVFRFDVLSTDVPMLIEIRDDSQMIRRAIDLADSISIVLSEVSAVLGGDKRGKC